MSEWVYVSSNAGSRAVIRGPVFKAGGTRRWRAAPTSKYLVSDRRCVTDWRRTVETHVELGCRVRRRADGSRTELGCGEARGRESPGGPTVCINRGVPRPVSVLLRATFVARTFVFVSRSHLSLLSLRSPVCTSCSSSARAAARRTVPRPPSTVPQRAEPLPLSAVPLNLGIPRPAPLHR